MSEVKNMDGSHMRAANPDIEAKGKNFSGRDHQRKIKVMKGAVGRVVLTEATAQEKPWSSRATRNDSLW